MGMVSVFDTSVIHPFSIRCTVANVCIFCSANNILCRLLSMKDQSRKLYISFFYMFWLWLMFQFYCIPPDEFSFLYGFYLWHSNWSWCSSEKLVDRLKQQLSFHKWHPHGTKVCSTCTYKWTAKKLQFLNRIHLHDLSTIPLNLVISM